MSEGCAGTSFSSEQFTTRRAAPLHHLSSKLRPRSRRLWWRPQDEDEEDAGAKGRGRSAATDTAQQPRECKQQ